MSAATSPANVAKFASPSTFAGDVAADVIGADHVIRLPNPIMGAEDFSYVIQRLPGAMMFIGGTPADRDLASASPNYSNRVYFDEEAIFTVADRRQGGDDLPGHGDEHDVVSPGAPSCRYPIRFSLKSHESCTRLWNTE